MTPEFLTIQPNELKFTFEVKKQSSCSVQLVNNTDQYVAYKVKTTSPKKYCVRPNIGVVLPNSICDFTVTMQAQRSAPEDMQCKDKFLIQSTVVPFGSTEEDITPAVFAKESGRFIQENKLRVVLVSPPHSPVLLPINGSLKQDSDFDAPVIRGAVKQESDLEAPVIKGAVRQEANFEAPLIGAAKQEPASEALITKGALKQEPVPEALISKEALKQEPPFEALLSNGASKKELAHEAVLQDQVPCNIEHPSVIEKKVEELIRKTRLMESELNGVIPRLTEAEKIIIRLREENSTVIQERDVLKHEVAILRSRKGAKVQVGFPFLFVCFVALREPFKEHGLLSSLRRVNSDIRCTASLPEVGTSKVTRSLRISSGKQNHPVQIPQRTCLKKRSFSPNIFVSSSFLDSTSPQSTGLGVYTQSAFFSNLSVVWRKDRDLDNAIEKDKLWRLCARVVKEVLNEPGQVIPVRYLEKRRERLRLPVKVKTFLKRNPGLFDIYLDRIKPKTEPVPFIRVGHRLHRFLNEEKLIREKNEPLLVAKLCKLLMMSKDKVVSADKLVHVKRDFGLPDDFLCNLVPRYPNHFRLVGCPGEGKSFLELVSWEADFAKSVIELRAEEESQLTGIRVRPSFNVNLPSGFFLKKEMREWVRDWMELPYVSPYTDGSHLDQASPEMEKRSVGVFHELLSLSILKRMAVPILGKFCEEYRFSNAFANTFTRHSGIFYVSLKGGLQTAMLREAYDKDELIDKDPLLAIKEKFVEMLAEGHREHLKQQRLMKENLQNEMKQAAMRNEETH
ncbi:hypothetical protein H6P81_002078 [Aristolochia fimbriata]|uniref:MSP domain-containing protein n=1 Tax=Aristolochia fimbriata TaxID=158543 RepID=A0AAV7FBJ0_ARIFI|nr:hypothetical protein H6P81_002078 [Aristolochia fimbriata]